MGVLALLVLGVPGQESDAPAAPAAVVQPLRLGERARESRRLQDRPEAGPSLAGFFVWTAVVVALLVGSFLLLKRFGRHSRLFAGGRAIQVLARRPLAPKQELFLVAVGPRVFLLGSSRERMTTLGEFAHPDEVAAVRAGLSAEGAPEPAKAFQESLSEGLREAERPARRGIVESIAGELTEIRKTVRAWR